MKEPKRIKLYKNILGGILVKKYISKMIELIQLERNTEISSMIKEIKTLSPEKREEKGNAIINVNGKIIGEELGYSLIKFGRKKIINTEIKIGDLVLISKNPLKSNYTGTVTEKSKKHITIAVEDPPTIKLKNLRIDLYANDLTYKRMEENLKNLSTNGQKCLEYLLKKKILKK